MCHFCITLFSQKDKEAMLYLWFSFDNYGIRHELSDPFVVCIFVCSQGRFGILLFYARSYSFGILSMYLVEVFLKDCGACCIYLIE